MAFSGLFIKLEHTNTNLQSTSLSMIYHDVEGLVEGFNWYYDQLLLFFKMKVYSEHAFLEEDPIRMDLTTSSTCSINLKGKC